VFNSLTISIITVVGGWWASGWVPGLPSRKSGVGDMVRFGTDIVGFNIVNYFSRNLDNVLIGKYYGSSSLGFYSKAYQLLMMPVTNLRDPMNRVAMPALSRLQNEPEQYRNYFKKYVSILGFISMPLIVFMFVFSDNIINLVLGSQWGEASELFKILALAAFIQPVASARGLILLTTGHSRRYLVLGVCGATVTSLAFVLGLPWGAEGVATAYVIQGYVVLLPFFILSCRNTPVDVRDFISSVFKPVFSSIVMGIGCYYLLQVTGSFPDIYVLTISFIFAVPIYLLALMVVSGGSKDVLEYLSYIKVVFGK